MRRWGSIGWAIWRAGRRLFLIVLSGVLGGILGQYAGAPIAMILGRAEWAVHCRCAGWTLFTLAAVASAIGFPSVLLRFWYENEGTRKPRHSRGSPPGGGERYGYEGMEVVGIKAVPVMCGVGALVGFICGSMLAGMMVALCIFVVLSPFAPDGWWPLLQQLSRAQWTGDGFVGEGKSPYILLCFIVFGAVIVLSAVLGPFWNYVDVGNKRYRVFRRKPKA
jgi:hypothetical protein